MKRWTNSRSLTFLIAVCSLAITSFAAAQGHEHSHAASRISFQWQSRHPVCAGSGELWPAMDWQSGPRVCGEVSSRNNSPKTT